MQPTTMPDIKELETTPVEEPKSLAEVAGEVPPETPASKQQPNVPPTDTSVVTPKQAN